MLKKFTLIVFGGLILMTAAKKEDAHAADPANTINMEVSTGGTVVIELLPDLAPKHVERIKTLASEGFYDGIIFHRVIDNFMAQTGDPTGTGHGNSKYPDLPAEFSDYKFTRGTVGMARGAHSYDSANSQFFICFDRNRSCANLDSQYTVWGQVTEGMEHIDTIAKGEPPRNPDKIVKMSVGGS